MIAQLSIRAAVPADAGHIARINVQTWLSTYEGILPRHILDRLNEETEAKERTAFLSAIPNDHCALVAELPKKGIVGFAIGGPHRSKRIREYDWEVYELYIQNDWQGKGIGRLLLGQLKQDLFALRKGNLVAWTYQENANKGFFSRQGGVQAKKRIVRISGTKLEEWAYVWKPQ